MSFEVRVHQGRTFDPGVVASVLGEPALPAGEPDGPQAPFLTIDGRIHRPTSDYLRDLSYARPDTATTRRVASDLRGWLDYLCNDRGLQPHEDHRDPVFTATERDFASYYRLRQYGPEDKLLSGEGWTAAMGAIKRFYEYAQRTYYHPPPFEIREFNTRQGWRGTTLGRYRPRARRTSSAGLPISPAWAEQLLMGALRVDLNGFQDEYKGADRDHAIISFCLATGMRRHNLAYVTTYEVPRLSDLPITSTRVADYVTKNDAGGDALTFTHRLPAVHNYIAGHRAEVAALSPHRPDRPLHIVEAGAHYFQFRDPAGPDRLQIRTWTTANRELRSRLVNPDGTSPILFLDALSGGPLAYSSFQHVVSGAVAFVRARINPSFPAEFRLHDLRHTYAVHLTVAIYRNVVADALRRDARPADEWIVDHLTAAVGLVQYSLGHASESSTRLYVQAAHRFLNIPLEHFLGLP